MQRKAGIMKELIGRTVKVRADGISVSGKVVYDKPDMFILEGKTGTHTAVMKKSVSFFSADVPMIKEKKSSLEDGSFVVLGCKKSSCKGVKMIKASGSVSKNDYESFMGECPCRSDKCKGFMNGELFARPYEEQKQILDYVVVGSFPGGK
jgi:hypothetical protein